MRIFRIYLLFLSLLVIGSSEAASRSEVRSAIAQARSPLDIVKLFVPSNPAIIEAGAHYGEDTVKMLAYWPQAHIFAFEPNPHAYNLLQHNTNRFPNILTYNTALFDYDGSTVFYIQQKHGNDGASSILPADPSYAGGYIDVPTRVDCVTLNSWSQDHLPPPIDFMWLDMEGAELYALKAGTDVLKDVKVIYTETNSFEFRTGMTQYTDLSRFLNEQGFVEIYHVRQPYPQGDAIFVRRELLTD